MSAQPDGWKRLPFGKRDEAIGRSWSPTIRVDISGRSFSVYPSGAMRNATRRFRCRPAGSSRPSGLALGATGMVSPLPAADRRPAAMPRPTSQARDGDRPALRQGLVVGVRAHGVGVAGDGHTGLRHGRENL